jgi:hypothetical protein
MEKTQRKKLSRKIEAILAGYSIGHGRIDSREQVLRRRDLTKRLIAEMEAGLDEVAEDKLADIVVDDTRTGVVG